MGMWMPPRVRGAWSNDRRNESGSSRVDWVDDHARPKAAAVVPDAGRAHGAGSGPARAAGGARPSRPDVPGLEPVPGLAAVPRRPRHAGARPARLDARRSPGGRRVLARVPAERALPGDRPRTPGDRLPEPAPAGLRRRALRGGGAARAAARRGLAVGGARAGGAPAGPGGGLDVRDHRLPGHRVRRVPRPDRALEQLGGGHRPTPAAARHPVPHARARPAHDRGHRAVRSVLPGRVRGAAAGADKLGPPRIAFLRDRDLAALVERAGARSVAGQVDRAATGRARVVTGPAGDAERAAEAERRVRPVGADLALAAAEGLPDGLRAAPVAQGDRALDRPAGAALAVRRGPVEADVRHP